MTKQKKRTKIKSHLDCNGRMQLEIIKVRKIKRFKDFVAYHKKESVPGIDWNMRDVFDMLDYLAKEIEKLK